MDGQIESRRSYRSNDSLLATYFVKKLLELNMHGQGPGLDVEDKKHRSPCAAVGKRQTK
jgi:hypothetical protein